MVHAKGSDHHVVIVKICEWNIVMHFHLQMCFNNTGTRELSYTIMQTCPYNVYPIEPHFYIEKLGFAGVYLFFLFLLQNIDCGYSLEPPRRGGSNV